ncbi:hypothetical protein O6H91_05G021400 [Diphasiastrum complanatum]|uniref:Uncharacterized protein n=1 Tax=Diphasiastrum complanatum TaxID=34168 RepID=A0ACC2DLG4_DIPCM|nr:hypothetical protein O6H91_05G021400 [Diphasiastrum complanatum]
MDSVAIAATILVSLLCIAEQCIGDKIRAVDYGTQLVDDLLGQPSVSFRHYSGYITVDEAHGRALFYWFFEADHPDPLSLPLAMWLNGGPGCSSVGNGALLEMGPFYTNGNGSGLLLNKYSWGKEANLIFLESPAGVGFSYSNNSSDYNTFNDESVAKDSMAFLAGWFQKFPHYRSNDFYLLGESYAGHYVPNLAMKIMIENRLPHGFYINLKGFLIGNPWTDAYSDNLGSFDFYHSHSMISDETHDAIIKHCDMVDDIYTDSNSKNDRCQQAALQADSDLGQVNVDYIYGPACNSRPSSRSTKRFLFLAGTADPCSDSVTPYLNLPEVQAALHVSSPSNWSQCSDTVFYNYNHADIFGSVLPTYRQLVGNGLRIWIYSGDVDGNVPTTGTRYWINQLKLPIHIPWYPWNHENQVGGWTQIYEGLTFITVRGAGHMVPSIKPAEAVSIFRSFLAGKPLSSFRST